MLYQNVNQTVIFHDNVTNAAKVSDQLFVFNELSVFDSCSIKRARLECSNE